MIEEIERQGMNAVCVFSNGMPVLELGMPSLIKIFEDYFCENGVPSIDVFINTMKFSLTILTEVGDFLIRPRKAMMHLLRWEIRIA